MAKAKEAGALPDTTVGYKRPPVQSQFKPGQSGNPSGRPKGSQNLKTLFHKIMREEVQLREGEDVRKITKAEAIMRGLVIGALKGDTRSTGTLLRLAEQMGQFEEEERTEITSIQRVIISPQPEDDFPAISDFNKEK
ncbi:DUF5681 domain-containing protein [Rhodoplanes sp. Z2-YC6860]|uniref:DUF5681 domain-containing protein n=1 Tax=Rhodoplanes sp. Z2-YC6860 TaxID=674703 RepID=UPI000AE1839B|nr:DUF5681 domain-containing protein [Rhodoplanes sp. Z2-YC6860]